MQYLGNNQYQIQNSQTGETRVVSGDDLPNYGLSAQANQQSISQPTQQTQNGDSNPVVGALGGISNLLRNVGLGGVSDAAAKLYGSFTCIKLK